MNPETLSEFVRALWRSLSLLCAAGALACLAFGPSDRAFSLSLCGLAFLLLSEWRHDELP